MEQCFDGFFSRALLQFFDALLETLNGIPNCMMVIEGQHAFWSIFIGLFFVSFAIIHFLWNKRLPQKNMLVCIVNRACVFMYSERDLWKQSCIHVYE